MRTPCCMKDVLLSVCSQQIMGKSKGMMAIKPNDFPLFSAQNSFGNTPTFSIFPYLCTPKPPASQLCQLGLARLVRPLEKNLDLTIIGPIRTLKIQGLDFSPPQRLAVSGALTINHKSFGSTKVGVVGRAPRVLAN